MFDDVPTNLPTGPSDPVPAPVPTPASVPTPTMDPAAPIMDEGVELHGSPDGTVSMPEPSEPAAPVVAQKPVTAAAAPSPAVEDLFADVQEPVSGNVAMPSAVPVAGARASTGKTKKMIIIVVVVLVVLGAIGAVAMFLINGSKENVDVLNEPVTPTTTVPEVVVPEAPVEDVLPNDKLPEVVTPVEELDTDSDGLTDAEEIRYGTMINKPDSDSDGLFDREEVVIYHTNPLVADTDGDGFLDGAEVQSGYDPNGPGRLTDPLQ